MSILSQPNKTDSGSKQKIHDASIDIADEFKKFVSDVDNLIKETASLTGDELAQAKIKLNHRINDAKRRLNSAGSSIMDQTRKTATITNEYVHESPWAIIGASTLASFVLGVLIGHRKETTKK
jgi:ElaB/YqjD/DUF883 family membrane-anchored ribosome-binding protein